MTLTFELDNGPCYISASYAEYAGDSYPIPALVIEPRTEENNRSSAAACFRTLITRLRSTCRIYDAALIIRIRSDTAPVLFEHDWIVTRENEWVVLTYDPRLVQIAHRR